MLWHCGVAMMVSGGAELCAEKICTSVGIRVGGNVRGGVADRMEVRMCVWQITQNG